MEEKSRYNILNIILAVCLTAVLAINLVFITKTTLAVDKRLAEVAPAKLEITSIVDSKCSDCFDLESFIQYFKEADVKITKEEKFEFDSFSGKILINKYAIKKIPTLIITGDLEKNSEVKSLFDEIGEIKNNVFVLTKVRPVYLNLDDNTYKGKFKVVFITDKSCSDCYDVTLHKNALENLAMKTNDQELVDITDEKGKELVQKYKIDFVPTIILYGELDEYENFQIVWKTVGTKEEDGAYVFRQGVNQLGKYRNLITGKVIDPFSQ